MEGPVGHSKAGLQSQLQSVLELLHAEGLFAAEEALARELDERYHGRVSVPGYSPRSESRQSTPGIEVAPPLSGLGSRTNSHQALDSAERWAPGLSGL